MFQKKTLDGIMKVLNKAAAELEEFIEQKTEEGRANAQLALEHSERSRAALKEGSKARTQLTRLKELISL